MNLLLATKSMKLLSTHSIHSALSTHSTFSALSTLSLCAFWALFSIHCATSNSSAGADTNCGDHNSLGFEETNFLHVRAIGKNDNAVATLTWAPLPGAVYSITLEEAGSDRPYRSVKRTDHTELRFYRVNPFISPTVGRLSFINPRHSSTNLRNIFVTITAESGGKTIGEAQTVNLGNPLESPSLTVTQENDNFSFKWNSVSGASKYELYQQNNEGKLTRIREVNSSTTTTLSIPASTLTTGQIYRYRLRACSNNACASYATSNLAEIQAGMQAQIQMNISRISLIQSIRVNLGSTTKVIAGKPSLLQVYLKVNSPIQGFQGVFQLSREATSANPSPTPLVLKTPVTLKNGRCSVVTFDLQNNAATWLVPGASLRIEANAGSTISSESSSYTSSDASFTIVEQHPLNVKLVPIQTTSTGRPSDDEMTTIQAGVKKVIDDLYPNHNTNIEIIAPFIYNHGSTPIDQNNLETHLSPFTANLIQIDNDEASPKIRTRCSDVFHGIIKGPTLDRRTISTGRGVGAIYPDRRIPPCFMHAASWLTSLSYDFRSQRPDTISTPDLAYIIAHEIGHNHMLDHPQGPTTNPITGRALCSPSAQVLNPYPYPHANASIGTTGYFASINQFFSPANSYDFMAYCPLNSLWISDFSYDRIRKFQQFLNKPQQARSPASSGFFRKIVSPAMKSTSNIPEQSEAMIKGWYILGSKTNKDQEKWTIDSIIRSSMQEHVSRIAQEELEKSTYKARVRRENGKEEYYPLYLVDISHSSKQLFTVWVPTIEPILYVEIQNANNPSVPLVQKSLGRKSKKHNQEIRRGESQLSSNTNNINIYQQASTSTIIQKVSSTKWIIPPDPEGGMRDVFLLRARDNKKNQLGSDRGSRDFKINAREGDTVIIYYTEIGDYKKIVLK